MKKRKIALTLSIFVTISMLTACGSKKEESVSAMNNVSIETEVSSSEETTDISESESETETESITESETETESIIESEVTTETETSSFTVTSIDITMYALSDSYTYDGPSTSDYDQKATVREEEQVRVIGKVNEADWYKIEQEGGITSFISAEFLTEEVPAVEEPAIVQSSQPAQTQTTPSTQNQVQQPQVEASQPEEQTPPSTSHTVSDSEVPSPEDWINPATGQEWQVGDDLGAGITYGGTIDTSNFK